MTFHNEESRLMAGLDSNTAMDTHNIYTPTSTRSHQFQSKRRILLLSLSFLVPLVFVGFVGHSHWSRHGSFSSSATPAPHLMLKKKGDDPKNKKHHHEKEKSPPQGCQSTIVIIRHCEKGTIREHCNAIGFERAQYIATLFGNETSARWPAPSYLFALAPNERKNRNVNNWREVETLRPLSNKTGVEINASYGLKSQEKLLDHIFKLWSSGKLCGKVLLICWKHSGIPQLAHRLGCGPDDGCPDKWYELDFDSTWQILYSYHKQEYPSFAIEEATKRKKKKNKSWGQDPQWFISGDIEKQGFDPLEFSKKNGIYESQNGE